MIFSGVGGDGVDSRAMSCPASGDVVVVRAVGDPRSAERSGPSQGRTLRGRAVPGSGLDVSAVAQVPGVFRPLAFIPPVGCGAGLAALPNSEVAQTAVPGSRARPLTTRPLLPGAHATILWSRFPSQRGFGIVECVPPNAVRGSGCRSDPAREQRVQDEDEATESSACAPIRGRAQLILVRSCARLAVAGAEGGTKLAVSAS
jgi:hypothetical protein